VKVTRNLIMRLKGRSKERDMFVAHEKKWMKTDFIIRSTMVRGQSGQ
jgi:hypothetical protein